MMTRGRCLCMAMIWVMAAGGFADLRADDRISLGRYLLKVQRYADAIVVYDELIGARSKDSQLYHNRGVARLHTGKLDPAIADFNRAIELNPGDAESYNSRGVAWFYKGAYDRASQDFSRAIELNPRFTRAYNQLAWLLAACPDPKYRNGARAVEMAGKAVELEPGAHHYDTLAAAYAEAGRFTEAVRVQKRALLMQLTEGRTQTLEKYTERLRAYEAGKPWREKNAAGMKQTETAAFASPAKPVETRIEISALETAPIGQGSSLPPDAPPSLVAAKPPEDSVPPPAKYVAPPKDSTTVPPDRNQAEGTSGFPYSILIGSSQHRQKANRIAMKMRARGDMAFVSSEVSPDNVEWHRILVGQFTSQADARKKTQDLLARKLKDPQPVHLPFAVQVGQAMVDAEARRRESALVAMGHIAYLAPDVENPGKVRTLIGAYETEQAAARIMQNLREMGARPRLVRR